MNKYLKKAFIISASALLFLSVGAGVNNVQARRYHYRYHRRVNRNKYGYWKHYRKHGRTRSYFVRYKTGYFHNGRWVRYKSNKPRRTRSYYRTQTRRRRARALAAKRRRDAFTRHHIDIILNAAKPKPRRVHHYHILVDGVDDGWTTNYRTYKNSVNEIKADIQKDEQQMQAQQEASDQQSQEGADQSDQAQPTDDSSQQTQTTDQTQSSQPANTDTNASQSNSVSRNISEMNSETLADINQDREENGLPPYQESQDLDQVANLRAHQYASDPSNPDPHIDPNTGNRYTDEDVEKLGLGNISLAENADSQDLGEQPTYSGSDVNLKNGNNMADQANDDMMNHDSFCNNGHRDNILGDNTNVGIGTAHNSSTDMYYLVEDFE